MSIIHDFPAIAKHARLKALDGTPQNVVQPADMKPVFDGYGMYADTAPCEVNPDDGFFCFGTYRKADGTPVTFDPPEQDPA